MYSAIGVQCTVDVCVCYLCHLVLAYVVRQVLILDIQPRCTVQNTGGLYLCHFMLT